MLGLRIFKSLLVLLIGLTATTYAIANLKGVGAMRQQIQDSPVAVNAAASWTAFGLVTLCHAGLAATAFKGAYDLFAARHGSPDAFKQAKTVAVWAGGLSLISWFILSLAGGAGLFQLGTDGGEAALGRAFALGTTGALTILFVWGTTD